MHASRFPASVLQALPASALACVSAVLTVLLGGRPLDPTTAAGVFPPWWAQDRAIAAAASAGDVLGVGAAPFIVIVRAPGADAAARLGAAGALFSIDARSAGACNGKIPPNV
jgi:hypothetical protein